MGFFDHNSGNSTQGAPLTPDQVIRVSVKYEDGVTFEEMTGPVTLVSRGYVVVTVPNGSRFSSKEEVQDAVTNLTIRETKAFIEMEKDAPSALPGPLGKSTAIMMKSNEFKEYITGKVEAELGLTVNRNESSIRISENDATREARKQMEAQREQEKMKQMDAALGNQAQYQQDYILYQGVVAPCNPIPSTPVPKLIVPFKSGTAKLELRNRANRISTPVEVEGVVAVDVSQIDPSVYAPRLENIADSVVAYMNLVFMGFEDVSIEDLRNKIGEICSKTYEALRKDGQSVLGLQIGKLYITGEEKKKYDYAEMQRKKMEEMRDPNKLADVLRQQKQIMREQKLAQWKAAGLTPLQGAQQEADTMIAKGADPKMMSAKSVLAVLGIDENGNVVEPVAPSAPAAAQAQAPMAAPAAPQATAAAPRPKFCQNCGKPLPPAGAFCQECGSRI